MSTTRHSALVEHAKIAISDVYQDQSVDLEQTLDSLEIILEHVQELVGAINEDIRRRELFA